MNPYLRIDHSGDTPSSILLSLIRMDSGSNPSLQFDAGPSVPVILSGAALFAYEDDDDFEIDDDEFDDDEFEDDYDDDDLDDLDEIDDFEDDDEFEDFDDDDEDF